MGALAHRARARADYVGFIGVREWPVVVSGLGVLLGLITILPIAVGIALSVIALVLGILTLVHDMRQLRQRWSCYEFSTIAAPFPRDQVPVPAAYPEAVYLHLPNRGTALVSDPVDRALWAQSFPIETAEEPYRLPAKLKATAPYVLPLRTSGRILFNGSVIGMRGEPLPTVGMRPAPIRLHRARFFDAECSNELCSLRITRKDTGEDFDLRRQSLLDTAGRVRTLAESELADVVGISTLAFTTDDWLILVLQSDRNSASRLLLAPSGSGSLSPTDLPKNNNDLSGTLHELVRAGMERELCEETGLHPHEITATKVVGFARWMERGAKPEFFGISRLSTSREDVLRRHPSRTERLYSSGILPTQVNLATLAQELLDGTELPLARSLPSRLREDGSLPLLLALRAAAQWCAEQDRPLPCVVEPGLAGTVANPRNDPASRLP